MSRSLGVPVKGATELCGYNLGIIISCTNSDSELKKKHVAILYQKLQESAAAGIVKPLKVCMTVNRANLLTNGLSVSTLCYVSDASYGDDWGEK